MKKYIQYSNTQNNFAKLRLINDDQTHVSTLDITNSTDLFTPPPDACLHLEHSQLITDAFIIIRLNEFDVLEETFGHSIVKELARLISSRIQTYLQPVDDLEQNSANEFSIKVTDIPSKDYIEQLVKKIEYHCNGEYVCSNQNFHITVSSGISIAPHCTINYEEQLCYARFALYQTGNKSSPIQPFFPADMLNNLQKRASLIFELRQALKKQRFVLHYQPQFSLDTQKMVAVEALLRIQGQDDQLIYPDHFIELAEETGLIIPIGHWVIQKACQQYRIWQDMGCAPGHIAVNISAKQLADNSLIRIVDTAVNDAGMNYSNLELEITEQSMVKKISMAKNVLNILSSKGVRIALDDFGTCYSSLAYLYQLPLNVLKIDRTFLQQLENNNQRSSGLIRSIIDIAKELETEVVAEGVESLFQQQFIKSVGCHFGQGYGYSKPQNVDIITSMLQPQIIQP